MSEDVFLDEPPPLPPPLPPRLPRTPSGATEIKRVDRQRLSIFVAVTAFPVASAVGVAAVFGVTEAVDYLTLNGLLGSLVGLTAALWPVAAVMAGVATDANTSADRRKILNAIAGGLFVFPAMVTIRAFISAHFSQTAPVWYGEWIGLMHTAEVVAACVWGLAGTLLAYSIATNSRSP